MFDSTKSKVDDFYFGYREIRLINLNEHQLPNPYVLRYLTSGNKQKASQHIDEIYSQVSALLDRAVELADTKPIQELSAKKIVDAFLQTVNDEGRAKVASYHAELLKAVSVGHHLAHLDTKRIGENPPVAKGLHIEALPKVIDRFGKDEGWAAHYCAHQVFYLARRGVNLA